MKIENLEPGRYVVAVSGGVDSMVLLDLLVKEPGLELIVAHLDHGIRQDSAKDARLVEQAANKYGLLVERGKVRLGVNASEAAAREARYDFLCSVQAKHHADGIITAHHQDDLLESAFLNILRGTGPRGIIAMSSNKRVIRPLLGRNKQQIYAYARENHLKWREDTTNQEDKYLRNYIRKNLIPKLSEGQKQQIIKNIEKVAENNNSIEPIIATLLHKNGDQPILHRSDFINLPRDVGNELVAYWLRTAGFAGFDSKLINRAALFIKTGPPNSRQNLTKGMDLALTKKEARLEINP